jgi:two-component system KDP operon response regulator KdpE
VRAGLRRSARGAEQTSILKLGTVQVDLARRLTQGPEGSIHLTPLEYRVLECLARQAGMVVRQGQLLRDVWGPDRQDDARGLRVCIKYLRDKLEPDPRRPRFLVTETGLGYRLCTDEVPLAEKLPGASGQTERSADR